MNKQQQHHEATLRITSNGALQHTRHDDFLQAGINEGAHLSVAPALDRVATFTQQPPAPKSDTNHAEMSLGTQDTNSTEVSSLSEEPVSLKGYVGDSD